MIGYNSPPGGGLTAKEASILGIGVYPGFRDYFDENGVDNGFPPDPAWWNVVENGGGTVQCLNNTADAPGFIECNSGAVNNDDALMHTRAFKFLSLKGDCTSIHLKARLRFNWSSATGEVIGFGFLRRDTIPASVANIITAPNSQAAIGVDDNVPTAYSQNAGLQTTDISAYISDNVWFDCEIIINAVNVTFYIDDVLVATHATNVPDCIWHIALGSTCLDTNDEILDIQYCDAWGA